MGRKLSGLQLEVRALRAAIAAAHDHLHHERYNEAHEALHCASAEEAERAVQQTNLTVEDSARVTHFVEDFNRLCARHRLPAATVVLVDSATVPGATSIQMGGCVETIQAVRHLMGKGPTLAVGDH